MFKNLFVLSLVLTSTSAWADGPADTDEAYAGFGGSEQGPTLTVGGRIERSDVLGQSLVVEGQGSIISPRLRANYGLEWGDQVLGVSDTEAARDEDGNILNHEYDKHMKWGFIPLKARAQVNVPVLDFDHQTSFLHVGTQLYGEVGAGGNDHFLILRGRTGPGAVIAKDGDGRGGSVGLDGGLDVEYSGNYSRGMSGSWDVRAIGSVSDSLGQWGSLDVAGLELEGDVRLTYTPSKLVKGALRSRKILGAQNQAWFVGINGRYDRNDVEPAEGAVESDAGRTGMLTVYAGGAFE